MNALTPVKSGEIVEAVIARGDIAKLTSEERAKYYVSVCQSVGLNPMTRPFEYITLNGKLTLYARKDATDQLRQIHKVSVEELTESERDHVFIVTAKVRDGSGRTDVSKGAVNIAGLKGEALANAMMKAETKAKRRATLSICGLGFLDETEIEDIPAEAKGAAPRVLKKDTREGYHALQRQLDEASTSADKLHAWAHLAAAEIATLPNDWRDALRHCYGEKLGAIRRGIDPLDCGEILAERWSNQQGNNLIKAGGGTVNEETGEVTDQVIWTEDGERPATASDFAPQDFDHRLMDGGKARK